MKRLCRQGDLPAEKLHNTWLIRKEVLVQFSKAYNPRPAQSVEATIRGSR